MPVRAFAVKGTANQAITTTVETVVLSYPGISTRGAGDSVTIAGAIHLTIGASTTGVTVRCRRGTTTAGTLVDAAEVDTGIASETDPYPFCFFDTPGEVAGQPYVVTVQQVGASAGATVVQAAGTITLTP